jgi:hypothetical protein
MQSTILGRLRDVSVFSVSGSLAWSVAPRTLEHIPPALNRGDSQRWVDERVWRS